MAKPKLPAPGASDREAAAAKRMLERIQESNRLAAEHEATLDPRQRVGL